LAFLRVQRRLLPCTGVYRKTIARRKTTVAITISQRHWQQVHYGPINPVPLSAIRGDNAPIDHAPIVFFEGFENEIIGAAVGTAQRWQKGGFQRSILLIGTGQYTLGIGADLLRIDFHQVAGLNRNRPIAQAPRQVVG